MTEAIAARSATVDVTRAGVIGGEENCVTVVTQDGAEPWPRMTKAAVAEQLAARIAEALGMSRSD